MLNIEIISCLNDNYSYLLCDKDTDIVAKKAIIDSMMEFSSFGTPKMKKIVLGMRLLNKMYLLIMIYF